ncbi:TPA: LOW QUALITY PROTEIN: hypothetical protein N0F65_011845, partial [Lagenidium giganteum]
TWCFKPREGSDSHVFLGSAISPPFELVESAHTTNQSELCGIPVRANEQPALTDLRARAAAIRANSVSERSRYAYHPLWTRLITWLMSMKPHLVHQQFQEAVTAEQAATLALRSAVHCVLSRDVIRCHEPITFDQITAEDYLQWLLSLRKTNGEELGFSTFNNHRAAFFNLFREYKRMMTPELASELSTYFCGLKRTIARRDATSGKKIKVGKDPLSYNLYHFFCHAHGRKGNMVFAHSFLTAQWHLMCRSSNTVGIMYRHIEWRGDAMCIVFAHMKNDQAATTRPEIYANPLQPDVCPILSLAIYWACFPFTPERDALFPGAAQYDRSRNILHTIVRTPVVAAESKRRGVDPTDVGTHSIRKGAATYCSSGSTSCPASTAVHLRAGWSLGGVQNTYLRYEAAGDMYVGRSVCGLPSSSEQSGILPPHFSSCDSVVSDAIDTAFGGGLGHMRFVLEFALASLAYHHPYLKVTLPPKNLLLKSPIFTNMQQCSALRSHMRCGLERIGDGMKASGVPSHCVLLAKMNSVEASVTALKESVVEDVVSGVENVVAVGHGFSRVAVQNAVTSALVSSGIMSLVERFQGEPMTQAIEATSLSVTMTPLHNWGGGLRRRPQHFRFSDGSVRQMWLLWMCGCTSPPLRYVQPSDLSGANTRKRLSDLRFLMAAVEHAVKAHGWSQLESDVCSVSKAYDSRDLSDIVGGSTQAVPLQRCGQLGWRTVVNQPRVRLDSNDLQICNPLKVNSRYHTAVPSSGQQ